MPETSVRGVFNPTVFIGIGGIGKNILFRIRRMIVENYKSLDKLPSVRFLHLDTDENTGPDGGTDINLEVMGQSLQFKESEKCNLSSRISSELLNRESVKNREEIKEWFDPSLTLDNNFQQGAGGIRPYGKLAFHYSVGEFREKLRDCISQVNDPNNAQKTASLLGMATDNQAEIYVVSSLVGGTGSGSFLEVCYNARITARGAGIAPYITGVFIISGDGLDDRRKANCYGALMELEYHFTASLKEKNSHFFVRYPIPDINPVSEAEPPADLCYIISHIGEGCYPLGRDQIEESVALNLYMDFGSVISNEKQSRRADITGPQDWRTVDEDMGRSRQFVSFGITTLEFPAPRVQDMMAHELASSTVKGWLFEEKKESPDLNRDIEEIELRLNENILIPELQTIDNKHIMNSVNTRISQQESGIAKLIDEQNITGEEIIYTTAKANTDADIESVYFSMDPSRCGEYARQIAAKSHDKCRECSDTIIQKVNELIESEFRGPKEAKAYINAILRLLEDKKNRFESQCGSFSNSASRKQHDVYEELQKFRNHIGSDIDRFATIYHNKKLHKFLSAYFNYSLKRESYRAALDMIHTDRKLEDGKVIISLKTLTEELRKEVDKYTDNLNSLSIELKGKAEEIKNTIINTPIANGIGLTKERLEEIEKGIIPDPSNHVTPLMSYVKDALSKKDDKGRITERAMIKNLILNHKENTKSVLLQRCNEICEGVRKISVATELKDKSNLREILKQKIRLSKPMIQATGFKSGEDIKLHWLATSDPNKDSNLAPILDIIDSIYQYRQGNMKDRHLNQLPDPYRIIFASEKGIFPLQRITILNEYRKDYKRIKPAHSHFKIPYPDILPTTQEDIIEKRCENAALLGKIFGFLNQNKEPESGYDVIFLSYFDEKSRTNAHNKVSEKWDDIEKKLADQQIEKEIDYKITEITFLEKLEELIDKKGSNLKIGKEKEKLWNILQKYLENIEKDMEGGDKNSEYQRQRNIIQAFRDKYSIHPPSDESGYSEQTESVKESSYTPHETEYIEEVRSCLDDDIISNDERRMLDRRMIRLGISKERADELEDIVKKEKKQNTSEEFEYIEEVRTCLDDGIISDDERKMLNRRMTQLRISKERADELEKQIVDSIR